MTPPPRNVRQYRFLELIWILQGACAALFFALMTGWVWSIRIGIVISILGLVVAIFVKYRSRFGPVYTLVGTVAILVLGAWGGAGAVSTTLLIMERRDLAVPAYLIYLAVLLFSAAVGAALECRRLGWMGLRRPPGDPPNWVERNLDATHFVIRRDAGDPAQATHWSLAAFPLLLAIALNVPLAIALLGGNGNVIIFLAIPALTGALGYVMLREFGPNLIRALYAYRLERRAGRKFFHEEYESIQQLRRTFWLSRWLMKDCAGPSGRARRSAR